MEIFRLVGSIMVDSSEANKSLSKTGENAEGLGKKLSEGAKKVGGFVAGVAGFAVEAGKAIYGAAKETAANLDVIDKGAQRMGISAEQYQELAYAAGLCGVEMSTMERAAKKLEGTGLNMDDAINQLMSIEDESARSQAAIDLFGESLAYQLQPMLNAGADGMEDMRKEAHKLGLVVNNDTVSAGASMNDTFSKIDQTIEALKTNFITNFFPILQQILSWVLEKMPEIQKKIDEVMAVVMPVIQAVIDTVMEALPPLWDAVMGVIEKLQPLIEPAMQLIGQIVQTCVQVIQGAIDLIMPYLEPIVESITALIEGFFALFNGDFEGFFNGVKTYLEGMISTFLKLGGDILNGLWDGAKGVWTKLSEWFTGIIDSVTGWFSGIGDSIAGWWDGLWGGGGDGSHAAGLPTVPYDGYKATLHRGETVLNANDTSKLLDALNNSGGDSGPVNITVQNVLDGKTIGEFSYQYNRRKARAMGV